MSNVRFYLHATNVRAFELATSGNFPTKAALNLKELVLGKSKTGPAFKVN